jgi:hypothetical protein
VPSVRIARPRRTFDPGYSSGVRVGLAFMLIAAACGSTAGPRRPEPLEEPARSSFVGYRPRTQGCIHGDCKAGPYARRVDDRTISGIVGSPAMLIEWERGACAGWSYRGPIAGDLPDGRGTLTPRRGPFVSVTGVFMGGTMTGRADAIAHVADDDKPNAVTAEMIFDPAACALHFDPAALESVVIQDVWFKSRAGVNRVAFRGLVGIKDDLLVPLRGVMVDAGGRASALGYFELQFESSTYGMSDRAVCLSARCANGDGAEHLGGGERFELFKGTFANGAKSGGGIVYQVDPVAGARELRGSYRGGELGKIRVVRNSYTIGDRFDALESEEDEQVIEGVGPTPLGVEWSVRGGMVQIISGDPEALTPSTRGAPADMGRVLALIGLVAQDLDRRAGIRLCLTCRWLMPPRAPRLDEHAAVVDGPRTPSILVLGAKRFDERRVLEAWLADHRQWVLGRDLLISAGDSPTLTGTADLVRADGSTKPIVFYRGRRIDPLGFKTVLAYEAAKDRDIKARARRAAATAAKVRAHGEKQSAALRRLITGLGIEQSQLENARAQIAVTASDAARYERVIRGTHAAVERASDAVIDALFGVDAALASLADDDPTLDAVAALGAYLRDHDERLRVLLLAFDAFEYSDDIERLATIRTAFAEDLAAFPIAALTTYLAELRGIMAGGALTYPGTAPPRKAPEPEP